MNQPGVTSRRRLLVLATALMGVLGLATGATLALHVWAEQRARTAASEPGGHTHTHDHGRCPLCSILLGPGGKYIADGIAPTVCVEPARGPALPEATRHLVQRPQRPCMPRSPPMA